jgi:ubiquinone/menaquinone biosynthesis C-methylase UbiE
MDFNERVQQYWNRRSEAFGDVRRRELAGSDAGAWREFILSYLPKNQSLHILDVGTGTGFLAILMAQNGYTVTGVDSSVDMLAQAVKNAEAYDVVAQFQYGDAQQLDFPDGMFNVILSRNLTWNLPDVRAAYAEWFRLLAPGGLLLNFDSNYGAVDFVAEAARADNIHHELAGDLLRQCEEIKAELPISKVERPSWDMACLQEIGFVNCSCRDDIRQLVHKATDMHYDSLPLFAVSGHKPMQ